MLDFDWVDTEGTLLANSVLTVLYKLSCLDDSELNASQYFVYNFLTAVTLESTSDKLS